MSSKSRAPLNLTGNLRKLVLAAAIFSAPQAPQIANAINHHQSLSAPAEAQTLPVPKESLGLLEEFVTNNKGELFGVRRRIRDGYGVLIGPKSATNDSVYEYNQLVKGKLEPNSINSDGNPAGDLNVRVQIIAPYDLAHIARTDQNVFALGRKPQGLVSVDNGHTFGSLNFNSIDQSFTPVGLSAQLGTDLALVQFDTNNGTRFAIANALNKGVHPLDFKPIVPNQILSSPGYRIEDTNISLSTIDDQKAYLQNIFDGTKLKQVVKPVVDHEAERGWILASTLKDGDIKVIYRPWRSGDLLERVWIIDDKTGKQTRIDPDKKLFPDGAKVFPISADTDGNLTCLYSAIVLPSNNPSELIEETGIYCADNNNPTRQFRVSNDGLPADAGGSLKFFKDNGRTFLALALQAPGGGNTFYRNIDGSQPDGKTFATVNVIPSFRLGIPAIFNRR